MNATPIKLNASGSRRFYYLRRCMNALRRLARDRIDDPDFDWFAFGEFVSNDMLGFEAGLYIPLGSKRPVGWPAPTAETALLYGREPVFGRPEDIPAHVFTEVAAGVAAALVIGHRNPVKNKQERADRLRVDAGMKLRLRLWHGLACWDASEAGWRWLLNQQRNARRRAKSARPHAESAEACEPWKAEGVSRRTYYRRKAAQAVATRGTEFVSPYSSISADEISAILTGAISEGVTPQSASSLVEEAAFQEAAILQEKERNMTPRELLASEIVRLGGARDAPHVQRTLDDFEALARMCEPGPLAALLSPEHLAYAAYEALRIDPPFTAIAAASEAWRAAA